MDSFTKLGSASSFKSALSFLALLCFFIFLATILGVSYFTQETDLYKFFNSDALTIFAFFRDVIGSSGRFKAWHFSNAPSYFPDFLIAFVAGLFSKQAYLQIFLSSLIQTTLLCVSIKLLAHTVIGRASWLYAVFAILWIIFLALRDITPYYQVLILNWHFGTYLAGLFYLFIYAKWIFHQDSILNHSNYFKSFLLSVLCAVSFIVSLSDALFIPLFSGALTGVGFLYLILRKIKTSQYLIYFLTPFAFSVFGTKMSKILVPNFGGVPLSFSGWIEVSLKLKNIASLLFNLNAISALITFFFLFTCVRGLVLIFNALHGKKIENFFQSSFLLFFCVSSLLSNLVAILLTNALVGDRYMPALFFAPFVFFFICSPKLFSSQKYIWVGIALLFVLHANLGLSRHKSTWKDNFYPDDVACIDRATSSLDSPSGLAEYWLTKRVVTFSRANVRLVSVNPDLTPYRVLISDDWYRNDYNFAIVNTSLPKDSMYLLSEDLIVNFNGQPDRIIYCNDLKILLYPEGLSAEINPMKGTGIHAIQGCRLPKSTGSIDQSNACSLKSNNPSYSGNLSYGPYLKLDPGDYEFRIKYTSINSSNDVIGHLDVSFLYADRHEVVSEYKLSGTDSEVTVFKNRISISQDNSLGKLEVRTFILPNTQMELFAIEVEKIKPQKSNFGVR
jgi:hypothetical protein